MGRMTTGFVVSLPQFSRGAEADEQQLKQFVSQHGRFSVLMPGTPIADSEPVRLEDGGTITIHSFVVALNNDNVTYTVTYSALQLEQKTFSPQAFLERSRDAVVSTLGAGARLLSDSAIDLDGAPGRAFAVQKGDDIGVAQRVYVVNDRLYQLIVGASNGHRAANRDAFLNSFRIVGGRVGRLM